MAKKQFIESVYQNSKMVYEGKLARKNAIQNLVSIGMKYNSAVINVDTFDCIINNKLSKRTLSAPTFEHFLNKIQFDFGEGALKKSLDALEKHISYLESKRTSKMHLVRKIYDRYRAVLDSKDNFLNDEERVFPEGNEKYRLHKYKERSRKLIIQAKVNFKRIESGVRGILADCTRLVRS